MFTYQDISIPPELKDSTFTNICVAALNKNKNALWEIDNINGFCISMFADPAFKKILLKDTELKEKSDLIDMNPIIYLAWKKQVDAVNFLIKHFYGCREQALYGYGLKGDEELVNNCFALEVKKTPALKSAILAGNDHLAHKIMIQDPEQKGIGIVTYALIGLKDKVEIYFEQLKKEYKEHKKYKEYISEIEQMVLLHYVLGKHNSNRESEIKDIGLLIQYQAQAGNQLRVNALLENAEEENKNKLKNYADQGYVLGHHQPLIDNNNPISLGMSVAYAQLGNRDYKKYLEFHDLNNINFVSIAQSLIIGNHHTEVLRWLHTAARSSKVNLQYVFNEILKIYSSQRRIIQINNLLRFGKKYPLDINLTTTRSIIKKNYRIPCESTSLLRLLSFTNNKDLRILFAKKAEKAKISDTDDLEKQAKIINKMMRGKYKFSFNQGLAFTTPSKIPVPYSNKPIIELGPSLMWILQAGPQLVAECKITLDVFLNIAYFLGQNLSRKETENIYRTFRHPSKRKIFIEEENVEKNDLKIQKI